MALTTVEAVAGMLRWGTAERAKWEAALGLYIDATSEVVEAEVGPIAARTIEHIADGGPSITLPHRPNEVTVVEVAGPDGYTVVDGFVVPSSSFSAVDGYAVDLNAGIVYGPFPRGRQNVKVTYTVGYAAEDIPASVTLAVTMLVVDTWAIASQRAPGLDDGRVDVSFLTPKKVREYLEPHESKQMPGFA